MNFINDRDLARRLKADKVASKEAFIYFLALMALLSSPSIFSNELPSYNMKIIKAANYLIDIIGLVWLYMLNKKGDNKKFVERYACIAFPVIVQTIIIPPVIFLIIIFIAGFINAILGQPLGSASSIHTENSKTILIGLYMLIANIFYYFRFTASIKIAAGVKK